VKSRIPAGALLLSGWSQRVNSDVGFAELNLNGYSGLRVLIAEHHGKLKADQTACTKKRGHYDFGETWSSKVIGRYVK
jgi:hypothetical protein